MPRAVRIGLALAVLASGCERTPSEPAAVADRRYVLEIDLGPTIAQLAADEQSDVDEAVERLAGYGDAVVPVLERALARESRPVQLALVDTLTQIESERAFGVLVGLASASRDAELRATALLRLGERGWSPARPALEAALNDPSDMVRRTAAVACGAVCTSPAAIDRIVELGLRDVPDVELGRVRASLARLMDGSDHDAAGYARETVRARTAPLLAADAPTDLQARAALLAADVGAPDVERPLLAVAAGSKNLALRAAAFQWLGRSGTAAAVPVLEAGLREATIRSAAALALQAQVARGIPEAKDAFDRLAASQPTAAKDP
jgi:HEAT repeat protein